MMSSGLASAIAEARGGKHDALLAVRASLEASEPRLMVRRALKLGGSVLRVGGLRLDLQSFRRTLVVGGGKASGLMAVEVEAVLGRWISDGVVVVPEIQKFLPELKKVKFARSTHPFPTQKGVRATQRMLGVLDQSGTRDLVICLISGGGSALMPLPLEGVSVRDLADTTRLLLDAGAEIHEVNCVRKHLSQVGGGRLAERARGAMVVSLVVSDVAGDELSSVASGPTVPDPTTYQEALRILKRRGIWERVPVAVRRAIVSGAEGRIGETPKRGPAFGRVKNLLVGSNRIACEAARASLRKSGYAVSPVFGSAKGDARAMGARLARLVRKERRQKWGSVWGGETTVTVRGKGVGGRNQEVALAAAVGLRGSSGAVVVSFGTDGIDGPTDAAGAIVDSGTYARAKAKGLDPEGYLEDNDSHSFFRTTGGLLVTGPTGTNVNDVMIALRE